MKRKGFTLIEMLVVVGILMILVGTSIAAYSKMTMKADRERAQAIVTQARDALEALINDSENITWPTRLINAARGEGLLDENAALSIAKYMSLTTSGSGDNVRLDGLDRFGVVTPWATAAIKRAGRSASSASAIKVGNHTVKEHTLHFALDLNGDGKLMNNEAPVVGGESVPVRGAAAVWCVDKNGSNNGQPWKYSIGIRRNDIYSWSYGDTQEVQ